MPSSKYELNEIRVPDRKPPEPKTTKEKKNVVGKWEQWKKQPTPDNTRPLLKEIDPIITSAMRSYTGDADDKIIKARGKKLALDALKTYDPKKAQINTYLMSQLQPLKRFATKRRPVQAPERVLNDSLKLAKIEDEFEKKRGRHPSLQELADYSGLSKKRISYVRKMAKPQVTEEAMIPPDAKGVSAPGVITPDYESMAEDFVYQGLSNEDKFIFDAKTGRGGQKQLSVTEIARKLKMSPGTVSNRAKRIEEMIQQVLAHYD